MPYWFILNDTSPKSQFVRLSEIETFLNLWFQIYISDKKEDVLKKFLDVYPEEKKSHLRKTRMLREKLHHTILKVWN